MKHTVIPTKLPNLEGDLLSVLVKLKVGDLWSVLVMLIEGDLRSIRVKLLEGDSNLFSGVVPGIFSVTASADCGYGDSNKPISVLSIFSLLSNILF